MYSLSYANHVKKICFVENIYFGICIRLTRFPLVSKWKSGCSCNHKTYSISICLVWPDLPETIAIMDNGSYEEMPCYFPFLHFNLRSTPNWLVLNRSLFLGFLSLFITFQGKQLFSLKKKSVNIPRNFQVPVGKICLTLKCKKWYIPVILRISRGQILIKESSVLHFILFGQSIHNAFISMMSFNVWELKTAYLCSNSPFNVVYSTSTMNPPVLN